jgi:hypothetical protein
MARPSRLRATLVPLFLIGGLVTTGVILERGDKPTGPDFPDAWDDRVLPYVEIVEKERGLRFEHPVHVDFLSTKAFDKEVTTPEGELDEEDREGLKDSYDLLRALDLVPADFDVLAAANTLGSGGVVGLYSFEDQRIRINGTELTPASRSTLVHELTHALQDQHFAIGERSESLAEDTSGASSAWDALVEGDASRIESRYAEGLTRREQRALERDQQRESDGAGEALADVPEVLTTMMGAPYALGEALLDVAVQDDGDDAVDELFETPPTSEEHLLDPWSLTIREDEPEEVEAPPLADGETEFDSGTFGALGWYLVLAARVPATDALDATLGWGGDSYVAYREDEQACVRIAWSGDHSGDDEEMESALKAWIAAGSAGTATVERDGSDLLFQSCASENDEPSGSESTDDALGLALTRTYLTLGAIEQDVPPLVARCVADEMLRRIPLDHLSDDVFGKDPADVEARDAAWLAC